MGAVEPGRPEHHGVGRLGSHRPLPRGLGAAVSACGGHRCVGGHGGAVRDVAHDVVRRDVHDPGAGGSGGTGQHRRTDRVDGERLSLVGLRVVHRSPGGGVDHDVVAGDRVGHRGGVGDVEVGAAEAGDVVVGLQQRTDEVGSQHAGRAGDEYLHGAEASEAGRQ